MTPPSFLRLIPFLGVLVLASCGTPKQSMNLTGDALSTPSHSMSHGEYPFDDGGGYVDSWAAEGAGRFPASVDSDRSDEGRKRVASKPSRSTSRSSKTASRSSKSTGRTTAKSSPKPKGRTVTVTVKKTDTLYSLARKYGTSVGAIKSANGLKSDVLRTGRTLKIPR